MIQPYLFIAKTGTRGRGVFTSQDIPAGTLVEVSPVIAMPSEARVLLDQTLMHDYIFEWGGDKKQCCVALGYLSLYNHASPANCDYEMDFEEQVISIRAIALIPAGDELRINYNGEWNNPSPVWFETR